MTFNQSHAKSHLRPSDVSYLLDHVRHAHAPNGCDQNVHGPRGSQREPKRSSRSDPDLPPDAGGGQGAFCTDRFVFVPALIPLPPLLLLLLLQILPPEAKNYRNAVEQITNFRLNVVEKNEDVSEHAVAPRADDCGDGGRREGTS